MKNLFSEVSSRNILTVFSLFLAINSSLLMAAGVCDIDGNNRVEQRDIESIFFSERNRLAETPFDPMDIDRNGVINTNDARQCVCALPTTADCDSPLNQAPVANPGPNQTITQATFQAVILNGGASGDADGDFLNFLWSFQQTPQNSQAVLLNANTVSPSFTPDRVGVYVLSLTVTDGFGDNSSNIVTINVNTSPSSLQAVADSNRAESGDVASGNILNNDIPGFGATSINNISHNGQPITLGSLLTTAAGGSFLIQADGAYTYTSPSDLEAPIQEVFSYTINDQTGASSSSSLTITVDPVIPLDQLPVAEDDSTNATAGGPAVTGNVLTNDEQGDQPTQVTPVSITVTEFGGSFNLLANGDFTYTLPTVLTTAAVQEQFPYTITDSDGDTSNAILTVTVNPRLPPIANPGLNQVLITFDPVELDGSGSSDPEGGPLTYSWSFQSQPPNSQAVLIGANTVNPSFTPNVNGVYVVSLTVTDVQNLSNNSAITITVSGDLPPSPDPIANAGPDQPQANQPPVVINQVVALNGSQSSDPSNSGLSFLWSFQSRPPNSQAELSSETMVNANFMPDVAGTYVIALTVTNEQGLDSAVDTVTITVLELLDPIANAGPDQPQAASNQIVMLDGSGSSDPDGGMLTYVWSFESQPTGSQAVLAGGDTPLASFTPTIPGTYTVILTVTDDQGVSAIDRVMITVMEDPPPIADAGSDQSQAASNQVVMLDGSGSSDPDGGVLTYAWSFESQPLNSQTVLAGADTPLASFTPTIPGTYTVILTVTDDQGVSAIDRVMITVMEDPPPIADAGRDQPQTANNQVVMLDGSASIDPDGGLLTYAWSFESQPTGSQAVLTGANTPLPSFTPTIPGTYTVILTVTDDQGISAIDRVMITVMEDPPPIADAGSDQPQAANNQIVMLDGSGSSDPDGGVLTYVWSFESQPTGSQTVLAGADTPLASFTPTIPGTYTVILTVTDDQGISAIDRVMITVMEDPPPIADAGSDQPQTDSNQVVMLDGSGSSDPDGGVLTYAWSFESQPPNSQTVLAGADTPLASFTPTIPGTYTIILTVTDDQGVSAIDRVMITVMEDPPPIADAGPDQPQAANNQVVMLDGSGSSDPDGGVLTYAWSFESQPLNSQTVLAGADTPLASFTPTIPGTYTVILTVTDDQGVSAIDRVMITVMEDPPPIADAGSDQPQAANNQVVMLDGNGSSDPDGGVLTYVWSFESRPTGSQAVLAGADTPIASFTPTIPGTYTVILTVTDDQGVSAIDRVMITVMENPPPIRGCRTESTTSRQ